MSGIIDVLCANLEAWEGEEDSVREEHADLIQATREALESDDARLIAAAPEMLAALDRAEAFIAGFEDDDTQEGIPEMLAAIRAALRKAKGAA